METTAKKTHMQHVRETWGTPGNYVAEVWGPDAVHDLTPDGLSILIHLDRPTTEVRNLRMAVHVARAADLAQDDCPLCREMASFGGDEVFDERGAQVEPDSGRDLDLRAGPRSATNRPRREAEPGGGIDGPGCSAPLPPVVRERPSPAPAPAKIPAESWLHPATVRAIRAVGKRAIGAVYAAHLNAPPGSWTRAGVEQAAAWLESGDRRAGISRRWPMLAARLRNALELTPRFAPGAMLDAAALPRGDAQAVRP